jgi:hypothetical protein
VVVSLDEFLIQENIPLCVKCLAMAMCQQCGIGTFAAGVLDEKVFERIRKLKFYIIISEFDATGLS